MAYLILQFKQGILNYLGINESVTETFNWGSVANDTTDTRDYGSI